MTVTRRQREILDVIQDYSRRAGYAPTLAEIGRELGLTSVATVHKHLRNLEDKGLIRRQWNRSRAVEIVAQSAPGIVELPLLGVVAAGVPIEPVEVNDILGVPRELVRSPDTFALRVKGDSMIDEQIRDGDLILVQSAPTAREGETVVALVRGEATVKRFYRVDGKVVLRPANERLEPIVAEEEDVEIRGVVVAVIRKY